MSEIKKQETASADELLLKRFGGTEHSLEGFSKTEGLPQKDFPIRESSLEHLFLEESFLSSISKPIEQQCGRAKFKGKCHSQINVAAKLIVLNRPIGH